MDAARPNAAEMVIDSALHCRRRYADAASVVLCRRRFGSMGLRVISRRSLERDGFGHVGRRHQLWPRNQRCGSSNLPRPAPPSATQHTALSPRHPLTTASYNSRFTFNSDPVTQRGLYTHQTFFVGQRPDGLATFLGDCGGALSREAQRGSDPFR